MNTTHRAPRPRVNLPPLPTEIWLNILERACSAGDLNPFGLSSVSDFSPSSACLRKKIFRESLVTKRYVVRVCKQWNVWASPYLYESIYLGRIKCLHSLRDALVRARDSDDTNIVNHASGRWTKRLDIAMRDNPSRQDDEVEYLISEIVLCLPTLSIINFGDHHHRSSSSLIIRNLANTCGSTLQAVVWGSGVPPPAANVWRKFLEKAAHIRFLQWPQHLRPLECEVLPPVLPSLELLRVDTYLMFGHFPSLRHLVFEWHYSVVPTKWKLFLELNGIKLEVVHLNISAYCLKIMILLFDLCPNLVRLNLSMSEWGFIMLLTDSFNLPTKLRILGLQSTAIQSSSRMYGCLFRELEDMQCTSSLSCIQFIDAGNVKDLTQKHHSVLTRGLEMLKKKGLELRDHEGCLMG